MLSFNLHVGAWVSIDLLAIHLCPEIWDEPFVRVCHRFFCNQSLKFECMGYFVCIGI